MPKRIAVHTVVVQREGQRKEILPGTLFDFTVEEVKELEALKAIRKPVVEDAEQAAAVQVAEENTKAAEESKPAAKGGKAAKGAGEEL